MDMPRPFRRALPSVVGPSAPFVIECGYRDQRALWRLLCVVAWPLFPLWYWLYVYRRRVVVDRLRHELWVEIDAPFVSRRELYALEGACRVLLERRQRHYLHGGSGPACHLVLVDREDGSQLRLPLIADYGSARGTAERIARATRSAMIDRSTPDASERGPDELDTPIRERLRRGELGSWPSSIERPSPLEEDVEPDGSIRMHWPVRRGPEAVATLGMGLILGASLIAGTAAALRQSHELAAASGQPLMPIGVLLQILLFFSPLFLGSLLLAHRGLCRVAGTQRLVLSPAGIESGLDAPHWGSSRFLPWSKVEEVQLVGGLTEELFIVSDEDILRLDGGALGLGGLCWVRSRVLEYAGGQALGAGPPGGAA